MDMVAIANEILRTTSDEQIIKYGKMIAKRWDEGDSSYPAEWRGELRIAVEEFKKRKSVSNTLDMVFWILDLG